MPECLQVIALISGGKDSFFSLLHCLQNGHKVIALGNLYPAVESSNEEERDLNSFMYQTVGHQVIPLYSEALGLPLYRQEIRGTAVVTGLTYAKPKDAETQQNAEEEETESLMPLLQRIMKAHPEANALSTGAILSTYQRTRVESIALRLGLTPLSYLWQYPFLPDHSDITLLQHMSAVNLDARIIKVASGGLDESFLWENVASARGMTRLDKAARRFGVGGGAIMGEGGEYETLVIDGPDDVFKGRIVVEESDRLVVREGGGAAWLRIKHATVVMKDGPLKLFRLPHSKIVDEPQILESQFNRIYHDLIDHHVGKVEDGAIEEIPRYALDRRNGASEAIKRKACQGIIHCTFSLQSCLADGPFSSAELTLEEEMQRIVASIRKHLDLVSIEPTEIVFAMIMLRSMEDFGALNQVYGTLFPCPNPPARVTIACGDVLPEKGRVMINLTLRDPSSSHKYAESSGKELEALHVQSRSYWAPANIGPYSQAISIPSCQGPDFRHVYVAGQIPLVPATMTLPHNESNTPDRLCIQAVLSLQHLWQIGREIGVDWWIGAIAFLERDDITAIKNKANLAAKIWTKVHEFETSDEDEEEERDLWAEKHQYELQIRGGMNDSSKQFPDCSNIKIGAEQEKYVPPFFAAEVEELPRHSSIEWQALLGLRGGPYAPSNQPVPNLGTVHQFTTGKTDQVSHYIIAIPIGLSETCERTLGDWHRSLGCQPTPQASYIDITVKGLWSSDLVDGVVPCRSLWDSDGNRLAAVIVYMQ